MLEYNYCRLKITAIIIFVFNFIPIFNGTFFVKVPFTGLLGEASSSVVKYCINKVLFVMYKVVSTHVIASLHHHLLLLLGNCSKECYLISYRIVFLTTL